LEWRSEELALEVRQRSAAEAELIESREQFRRLFIGNPLPMWIYDRDTLKFLEVNDAAVANYGYSRNEVLTMRLTDIRPSEDVDRLLESRGTLVGTYEQSSNGRHRRKNGDLIQVDVYTHEIAIRGHNARLAVAID